MKIIREGDLSRITTVRRFECPDCGCIWEANAAEYHKEWDRNNTLLVCKCPTCHHDVYIMPENTFDVVIEQKVKDSRVKRRGGS